MRMKTLSLAVGLLLAGCATTGPDTAGTAALQLSASPDAAAQAAAAPAADSEAAVVKELEISAFAEDTTVCRREAPLGSRIAVERCWSTAPANSPEAMSRSQIERDEFEEMRQRQMMIDQQRAARDTAFRQRAMMPPSQ
jgi:hypothetical protein